MFSKTKARKHGFFTVDLKEDETGRPYITEINIRHVAFTGVLAMAGANLCEDTIRILDNDSEFDTNFHQYIFEEEYLFLREVDALPILIKETDLL
ncbi:MAG: hypothetical protein IPL46_08385 [Saprospiraceae bacterium]|nr:hypothetical protein [Saprospiraceae bacterium]